MINRNNKWIFILAFMLPIATTAQKRIGDLTLLYNSTINIAGDSNRKIPSTTAYYLKGNLSRAEVNSSQFSSVTIYDSKAGSGVILREVNGQKLLIRINEENWNQKYKRFAGLEFAKTNETKTIAGYFCSHARTQTPDGLEISVYYTRDLIPENKFYDPQFKNLDGLPLEYELQKGNLHIRYTLASISLNPVPASKFDIPTSGYREMTYDESMKLKSGNQ